MALALWLPLKVVEYPNPSVGRDLIDDTIEEVGKNEENCPVDSEKLHSNDIPSTISSKFMAMLKQLTMNVPLVEALEHMPGYAKFIKDLVTKKRTKEADPGEFTILCTIRSLDFPKALCDLGASINLMLFVVYNKLDFVILDFKVDFEVPIILGRPFLIIESVLIYLWANDLLFRFNGEVVWFDVCQSMKQHKEINVFSIVDVYYEDEREVPIEEKFVVETLPAILMNFDSEGIEKYE
ncbi:uncharacterized protein LOC107860921 [Capsicum annuum]|uniref:uncharacterized protein LOC107860921 n=1 Tax=Capsicum annuum TaxID=4072 RepID=UPI0007BF0326|nr:uncharacterized protein LOC107860921 [Capsicum annuum]